MLAPEAVVAVADCLAMAVSVSIPEGAVAADHLAMVELAEATASEAEEAGELIRLGRMPTHLVTEPGPGSVAVPEVMAGCSILSVPVATAPTRRVPGVAEAAG